MQAVGWIVAIDVTEQMKNKAFTLIELLVVITIIALLLTILMPSLMRAKEQARGLYCRNNLRQMAVAASSYTLDNDDYFPIAHYTKKLSGPVASFDEVLIQETIYSYCWDFTTIKRADTTEIVSGVLWQGQAIEKIQQCPSYKGGDNWSGSPYTGYNYNTSFIGHGEGESVRAEYAGKVELRDDKLIVFPAKVSSLSSMASCALFGDGQYAGGANKFMRSPIAWDGDSDWTIRPAGTQGFRHNSQTNIGWADGHASAQQEIYTETHPKYKTLLDTYNQTNKTKIGFISTSNNFYDLK